MRFSYEAIIIDPHLESRTRLKEATKALNLFHNVNSSSSFTEAEKQLKAMKRCDLFFISERLSGLELQDFMRRVRNPESAETLGTRDSAFVVVLESNGRDSKALVDRVLNGADGILCAPFSVQALIDTTEIAERVKRERGHAREKAAIRLFVRELIDQIDHMSHVRRAGYEPGISVKVFRDMCSVLGKLDARLIETYLETALTLFPEAQIPSGVPKARSYSGASQRVRKKFVDRAMAKLQDLKVAVG